jgi:hypothetical protein
MFFENWRDVIDKTNVIIAELINRVEVKKARVSLGALCDQFLFNLFTHEPLYYRSLNRDKVFFNES